MEIAGISKSLYSPMTWYTPEDCTLTNSATNISDLITSNASSCMKMYCIVNTKYTSEIGNFKLIIIMPGGSTNENLLICIFFLSLSSGSTALFWGYISNVE
jgi:hypothetical protein